MYKIPKGTQDLVGSTYTQVNDLIQRIEKQFVNAGGIPLETPVFERTDVLLGKYGEEAESKLIYKLADEGGEQLSLRYDLTVPFVRYAIESGIKQMRRYSIGKVYRRDQPNMKSGRFREFYQADFDIYGEKQEGMMAEATLLSCVASVLRDLGLSFTVLINDIENLKYLLTTKIGIENWRSVCPAIDKLDKQSFESIQPELAILGISADQMQLLQAYLQSSKPFFDKTSKDYASLCEIATLFGFRENLVFTNSLARGLDYYTGFIWEFKLTDHAASVSAGGRYDEMLQGPAVGISLGISRLVSYLPPPSQTWKEQYFVTTVGNIPILTKLSIIQKLQKATDLPVLYTFTEKDKKLNKVLTDCCTSYIRYLVIIAEDELSKGQFIVKDLKDKTQQNKDIITL